MKSLFSILALILMVAGFAIIVLGYSPNTPPTDTDNETMPDDPSSPVYPPDRPWQDYTYPTNLPHDPVPISLFNIELAYSEFIGILLIVAGVILLALGGKL